MKIRALYMNVSQAIDHIIFFIDRTTLYRGNVFSPIFAGESPGEFIELA